MFKYKKFFCMLLILLLAVCLLSTTAFAAGTGDVAGESYPRASGGVCTVA